MNHTMPERQLSPSHLPDLNVAEVNAKQAEIESRADDEFDARSEIFCDWLESNARVRQDYRQFRAATMSEDEQIAIERLLGMRE